MGFRVGLALVGNVIGLGVGHLGGYVSAWLKPGFMVPPSVLMSHAWEPGAFSANLTGYCWIVYNACSLHVCAELAAELKRLCDNAAMHEAADLLLLTHLLWCGFGAGLLCTPMHWFGRTLVGRAMRGLHMLCALGCCWGQVAHALVASHGVDASLRLAGLLDEGEAALRHHLSRASLVLATVTTLLGVLNEVGPEPLRARSSPPRRMGLTWAVLAGELLFCLLPPWTPITYWGLLSALDARQPTFTTGLLGRGAVTLGTMARTDHSEL